MALLGMAIMFPSRTVAGSFDQLNEVDSLDDADLEAIRGGFETRSGMQISFGIEQVTAINGVLQTRMAFSVPNVTEHPAGITQEGWTSQLIQNGAGNTFALNAADRIPSQVLNVVQNTLDQQVIQHLTVIDLSVTGLNLFRERLTPAFVDLRPF